MKLKNLIILTSVLFVISIALHINENKRGTDLLAGSDYIKGLDIGKIQKIVLSFPKKGSDKSITLTRDSDKFVLENHQSYPAASDKINELIYKIASIQVKEKVLSNANDDQLKKYELTNQKANYKVQLIDNKGKNSIVFYVGKSHKGKGNYLIKEGAKDIYLSESSLWINNSYKDFVNTVLVKVKPEEIEKVSLKTDKEIQFVKKDREFVPVDGDENKFKKEKIEDFTKNFEKIEFNDFISTRDSKAQKLNFENNIQIQLKNKLIYKMGLAKYNSEYFIRLSALLEETPTQFVVGKDDSKEDLQKIEETIKAQTTAQKVNIENGAWLYKIDKNTYEKLAKNSSSFM